jgi:hypothetical protein
MWDWQLCQFLRFVACFKFEELLLCLVNQVEHSKYHLDFLKSSKSFIAIGIESDPNNSEINPKI